MPNREAGIMSSLAIAKAELGTIEQSGLVERFVDVWQRLESFREVGSSAEIREWITGATKGGSTPTVSKGGDRDMNRVMHLDSAQRNAHLFHELETCLLAIAYGQVGSYWDTYKYAGLATQSVFDLGSYSLSPADRSRALTGSQKRSVIKLKAMLLVLDKATSQPLSAVSELILNFEVRLGLAQQVLVSSPVTANRMLANRA